MEKSLKESSIENIYNIQLGMYVCGWEIKYVCLCWHKYDKVECKEKKFVATGFNRK